MHKRTTDVKKALANKCKITPKFIKINKKNYKMTSHKMYSTGNS